MFEYSFIKSEKDNLGKALAFPAALIIHAFIIGALIIIPLLSTTNLPKIEMTSAFIAPRPSPPPPPPPPPPPKKAGSGKGKAN